MCAVALRKRVRTGRAGEVVEAQPQHHRATDARRGAHPPRDPVDERHQRCVDRVRRLAYPGVAERVLRSDRTAPAAHHDRTRITIVRERVQVTPGTATEHGDEHALVEPGDVGDRRDAALLQLLRGHRADAPEPLDRERHAGTRSRRRAGPRADRRAWRPPLATLARNFVRAIPTVIARTDALEHLAAKARRDLDRVCPTRAPARRPRGTLRRSTAPRRVASCSRRPRRPPCSRRRTPRIGARPRSPTGTGDAPARRPSRCGSRTPWPRSSRPARPPRRRSPGGRAGGDRRAARPTRRRRRDRRAGSSPGDRQGEWTRTYVRIFGTGMRGPRVKLPPCATDGCRSRSSRPSNSATTPSPTTSPRAPWPTGGSPTSGSGRQPDARSTTSCSATATTSATRSYARPSPRAARV